jgi:outer membrane protein assembly factor BamB
MECYTYRYSVTRKGFAQTIGTRTSELLWVMPLNSSVKSSPVIADEILYAATMSGRIYALDLKSGKQFWMFNANSSISSTPSIDSGLVIFGTEKPGKIYALDAYTGLVRWQYEIPEGEGVQSSPAITEGKVVIGSEGYLRCFSQFEGDILWSSYIAGQPSSPAIANNTVYVTSSAYVYAFNFSTGALKWRYPTSWPIYSSPAVADGLVLVGAENDDQVFALEQETGRLVWSFKTGGWLTSPAIDSSKKLVIAGCRDARTYCINESTGYLKWWYISAPNHQSAPTISQDGLVYFGSTNGYFYCLDEDTGREIWKYYVGSSIASSPIVIYQHVIVASEEGKLFFFGSPFPEHNIAILNASLSPSKIQAGDLLHANFTVANQGGSSENIAITVNLNCSNNIIKNFAKINESLVLSPNENITYTLSLDLTGLPPGFCKLVFEAQMVPDETDASDNAYATDIAVIVARVDLDANGEINILDISKAAKAYGSKPGDSNWNHDADINKDNIVNIVDISLIAKEFGRTYP